ncbi:MAG: hypothetical protein MUC76_12635 [Spirochaetes bacterium]|nr:hypothetical protein [Spirochaetota bacterium]
MLRATVICVLGLAMAASTAVGRDTGLQVRGEYRQDARDYEDSISRFYRLASVLVLSERSSLNFTMVRNGDGSESHTWSLVLADASARLHLLAGNYTAAFGGGLLLGRPQAYTPDLFSWRSMNEEKNVFSPVKSGNPSYAFNGIAVSYRMKGETVALVLHSFFSIVPRYIAEDGYFSAGTGNSLGTIQASLERDCGHSEPATIRTGGLMLSLAAAGVFLIEPYYVYTDLTTPQGDAIEWDRENNDGVHTGNRNLHGAGVMLRYRDERLSVFLDSALSTTGRSDDERGRSRSTGNGVVCGTRFSHPLLSFSFAIKRTSTEFNAPYQSTIGERYPERGFFLEAEARPVRGLAAGTSFASQKKLVPAPADSELPYTSREKYFIRYSGSRIRSAELSARRYEKTSRGAPLCSQQAAGSLKLRMLEFLDAETSVLGQRSKQGGGGVMAKGGLAMEIVRKSALSVHYARTHVTGGERLYGVISPLANSSIPGMFITRTSDIIAARVIVRGERFSLSGRYLHQWARGETVQKRLEFAASGTF